MQSPLTGRNLFLDQPVPTSPGRRRSVNLSLRKDLGTVPLATKLIGGVVVVAAVVAAKNERGKSNRRFICNTDSYDIRRHIPLSPFATDTCIA